MRLTRPFHACSLFMLDNALEAPPLHAGLVDMNWPSPLTLTPQRTSTCMDFTMDGTRSG